MAKKLQKMAQNVQKWARTKAHFLKKTSSDLAPILRNFALWVNDNDEILSVVAFHEKNFHGAKIEIFGRSSLTAG